MTPAQQKHVGETALENAKIPKRNWSKVANGVSQATHGKVSKKAALAAVKACDTNGNGSISYDEAKACLEKHAKVLGLSKPADFENAKWMLARVAVCDKKCVGKTLK